MHSCCLCLFLVDEPDTHEGWVDTNTFFSFESVDTVGVDHVPVADLGGAPPACAPLQIEMFSISRVLFFLENLANSYAGVTQKGLLPLLRGISDSPLCTAQYEDEFRARIRVSEIAKIDCIQQIIF